MRHRGGRAARVVNTVSRGLLPFGAGLGRVAPAGPSRTGHRAGGHAALNFKSQIGDFKRGVSGATPDTAGATPALPLAVKDGKFGVRRDADQRGLGLDVDGDAKERREFTRRARDGDDGGALGHAKHAAGLAGVGNQIASAKAEIIHGVNR